MLLDFMKNNTLLIWQSIYLPKSEVPGQKPTVYKTWADSPNGKQLILLKYMTDKHSNMTTLIYAKHCELCKAYYDTFKHM